MKLNLDMIYYEISQSTTCSINKTVDSEQFFSHVEFLTEPRFIKNDILYICDSDALTEQISGTYLCTGIPDSIPDCLEIIVMNVPAISKNELYTLVSNAFQKYADWDEALLSALNSSNPLESIVLCSYTIFENPISIVNREFHLLVKPRGTHHEENVLSLDLVNSLKKDSTYINNCMKKKAFLYQAETVSCQCLHVSIFSGHEYMGLIVLFEKLRNFRSFDGLLLEHLALYIEPCFALSALEVSPAVSSIKTRLISILRGFADSSAIEEFFPLLDGLLGIRSCGFI